MDKKRLKELINKHGGFTQFYIEKPNGESKGSPEGAISFKGIASNGDLNRNGYIIVLEAWKKSIKDYMKNPQILLGHDMDKSIGKCTKMEITSEGLYVEGYVFDDYTDERFSRGLLNALSTGHLTKKFDFINLKTGEILTKTEFRRRWDEFWGLDEKDGNHLDNWVRRITETEIVEFSLVSIPANKKSLITSREELENWYKEVTAGGVVAKNNKSTDNNNVTQETMKMHTLTEADLEKFPTLAEKYEVGDAISAEAWTQISGEKTDTTDKADETAKDKKAEKSDEKADDDDTPAENADDGDDTAADDEGAADSEDEEPAPADGTDGEDDEAAEKLVISKTDREKLKAEAEEAKKRAERLAEAVESTACEEDEEKPKNLETVKLKDMEEVQGTVKELVRVIETQQGQINKLVEALENVPAKKGLILHNQFTKAEKADKKEETAENKDDEKVKKQAEEIGKIFAGSGLAHLIKK